MTHIIVTGSSGFIGKYLTNYLSNNNFKIWAISKSHNSSRGLIEKTLILKDYDRNSILSLESEFVDLEVHAIIHLGAYGVNRNESDANLFFKYNIEYPQALLELSNKIGIKNFISIGSVSEYKKVEIERPITEDGCITTHLYGSSKNSFSIWAKSYCLNKEISFIHLRLFNVYGPGENSSRLIPYLINRIKSKEIIETTDGNQVRDFIHIHDISVAIEKCLIYMKSKKINCVLNVCTGIGIEVKTLIISIANVLKGNLNQIKFGAIKRRKDEILYAVGSNKRIKSLLNWSPSYDIMRDLEEIIKSYDNS